MRRLQLAGALGVRIEKRRETEVTILRLRDGLGAETDADIRVLRETLGFAPDAREIVVTFGSGQRSANELALLTRSMWEILAELSGGVEVPEVDRLQGRAAPAAPGPPPTGMPIAHIHSSADAPADAFAAVRYRNYWFWIDDRDLASKRIFTFLTVFSSIAEKGSVPQVPIITIPAN